MLRRRTVSRRCTSADCVEVGFASSDWQMPALDQMNRAQKLPLKRFHSWYTFGMLTTYTLVPGDPLVIVVMAAANCALKSVTEVIWATVSVQRSFPPMRTVRYPGSGLRATTLLI